MERKDLLHAEQKSMTDISAVDEACLWADALVRREFRGPGDTIDAARHRAAQKHKLPERTLWALRYRKPKNLFADVYKAIQRAHQLECERQEAKLRHELEITKALPRTPDLQKLIDETEALLGSMASEAASPPAERTD